MSSGIVPLAHLEAIEKLTSRLNTFPPMEALAPRPTPETSRLEDAVSAQEATRRGPRLSPDLQRALDAYNNGYTSVRDLMAALKVTKHQAHKLQQELKSRHLVTTEQTPDACPSVRPSDPLLSVRTADRQENRTGGQTNGQREA